MRFCQGDGQRRWKDVGFQTLQAVSVTELQKALVVKVRQVQLAS